MDIVQNSDNHRHEPTDLIYIPFCIYTAYWITSHVVQCIKTSNK
jgi:hypothetical protein